MIDYIQQKAGYAIEGVKEFSKHPVKGLTEGVKNYWDLGLTVAAAVALTPLGNEFYDKIIPAYDSLEFMQKAGIGFVSGLAGVTLGGPIRQYFKEGGGMEGYRSLFGESKEIMNSNWRNVFGGMTAAFTSWDLGVDDPFLFYGVANTFIEALFITGLVTFEHGRLKNNEGGTQISTQNTPLTLEEELLKLNS